MLGMHDLANEKLCAWKDRIIENDVTVIAVSDWHKTDIQRFICDKDDIVNPRVTFIYNPVDDALYSHAREENYKKNKLVWMSSPHKGLGKAVSLFTRLKEVVGNDSIELHVFNPGYLGNELVQVAGVITYGPTPPTKMWSHIRDAMCVFYPCQFKETFGLVAAEANALGVPVATYELGALPEVVSSADQLVWNNDEMGLLKKVESWYSGFRPEVKGVDKFRTTEVVKQWHSLLSAKNT
jgi:glycosyltransferase involved in cell wall biosynthesis